MALLAGAYWGFRSDRGRLSAIAGEKDEKCSRYFSLAGRGAILFAAASAGA